MMLKIGIRVLVILAAAGILAGGSYLLVQNGVITNQTFAALGLSGRGQFNRTQFNPPTNGGASNGGAAFLGSFRERGGRGINLAAGLSDIVHNGLIIAAITMGVWVLRKLTSFAGQAGRRKPFIRGKARGSG